LPHTHGRRPELLEGDLISAIDPATLRAYRYTEYRVLGSHPAVLRVGVVCADLARLHAAYRTDCSAFVTAYNPLGEVVADAVNLERQAALAAKIIHLGLASVPGVGHDPTGEWTPEPSLLVPGLTRTAAQVLGRQFAQNAIVWSGADAIPELILLR
jgi:Protein of unknown function (DUF3293)